MVQLGLRSEDVFSAASSPVSGDVIHQGADDALQNHGALYSLTLLPYSSSANPPCWWDALNPPPVGGPALVLLTLTSDFLLGQSLCGSGPGDTVTGP